MTVEQAAIRFLADLGSRGLSKDTIKEFELLTLELSAKFPGWTVNRFTPDHMGRFREKWEVKPTTASKKLERLRSFFKFCLDRKWIPDNPASALRPPKETAIEKSPTTLRYYYQTHQQLKEHVQAFLIAHNFAKRLKTLRELTPYQFIRQAWQNSPLRFSISPFYHTVGLEHYPYSGTGFMGNLNQAFASSGEMRLRASVIA